MMIRRVILTIHLWAGLCAAIFLFALGVSGSLMAFENEIDRALNPKLSWVATATPRLSLAKMIARLEAEYPGYKVAGIGIGQRGDLAWDAYLAPLARGEAISIAFNPYSGEVLGNQDSRNDFMGTVHQFHLRLLAGRVGSNIVTGASAFLLTLAITGLILWWPRKLVMFDWRRTFRTLNLEFHQVLGLYTSAFLLVFSVTGLIVHWDNELAKFTNRVTGTGDVPPFPDSKPLSPGKSPDFDAILAAAQKAEPDAQPASIELDANPARITMRHPQDHTPGGRTILFVDLHTGAIVYSLDWRTAPAGFRLVKLWNREIHTGDLGGLPTRILASTMSLALPVLAITGPLIWWHRRRKPARQTVDPT